MNFFNFPLLLPPSQSHKTHAGVRRCRQSILSSTRREKVLYYPRTELATGPRVPVRSLLEQYTRHLIDDVDQLKSHSSLGDRHRIPVSDIGTAVVNNTVDGRRYFQRDRHHVSRPQHVKHQHHVREADSLSSRCRLYSRHVSKVVC